MKRLIYTFLVAFIIGISSNASYAAPLAKDPAKELTTEQKAQIQRIEQRVQEIRQMDKSQLSRQERKALKKELKDMNAQARAITGGGVYLSVGAIIIIILVLILIL